MSPYTRKERWKTLNERVFNVELFKAHVAPHVKIKAAGGISSIEDAEKFIALGADRLGTSRIVKIAKGLANDGSY